MEPSSRFTPISYSRAVVPFKTVRPTFGNSCLEPPQAPQFIDKKKNSTTQIKDLVSSWANFSIDTSVQRKSVIGGSILFLSPILLSLPSFVGYLALLPFANILLSQLYLVKAPPDPLPLAKEIGWPQNVAVFPRSSQNDIGIDLSVGSYTFLNAFVNVLKQPSISNLDDAQHQLSKGYRTTSLVKQKAIQFPRKLDGWQKEVANPHRYVFMVWDAADQKHEDSTRNFQNGLEKIYNLNPENIHVVTGSSPKAVLTAFSRFSQQVAQAPPGQAEVIISLCGDGSSQDKNKPIPRKEGDLPFAFSLQKGTLQKPLLYAMVRQLENAANVYLLVDTCHSGAMLNIDEKTKASVEKDLMPTA